MFETQDSIFIVSDYLGGGEVLERFLNRFITPQILSDMSEFPIYNDSRACKKLVFTEREAVKILREVLKALAVSLPNKSDGSVNIQQLALRGFHLKYIHDEQLVHGNLKPSNLIYVNETEESVIKVTDVALFKIIDKELLKHFVNESVQVWGELMPADFR